MKTCAMPELRTWTPPAGDGGGEGGVVEVDGEGAAGVDGGVGTAIEPEVPPLSIWKVPPATIKRAGAGDGTGEFTAGNRESGSGEVYGTGAVEGADGAGGIVES